MSASTALPTMPTAALKPAPTERCTLPLNVLTASVVLKIIIKSVSSPPAYNIQNQIEIEIKLFEAELILHYSFPKVT